MDGKGKNYSLIKTKNNEESLLIKTAKRFEEVIYGFIFTLLKEEDHESLALFHIFTIIEFIQMLNFPFHKYVRKINIYLIF